MPRLISEPSVIQSAGNKPKRIEEFIGVVNSQSSHVSIAKMTSPPDWVEPGQTPQFDEYTIVLKGMVRVTTRDGVIDVHAGQAIYTFKDEWVQYSTPDGAKYIAVCVPAFTPDTVRRDDP